MATNIRYTYPNTYPCGIYMFFSPVCKISIKSVKSPNLLIICLAEIAQLRSLERRSLLRSWSSNPCQGWGREFESRFPLLAGQQHIAGLPFFIQGTRTRDMLPEGAAGQGRLRGLRKKSRHARVRGLESRFPLQAGQHIAGLLFFIPRTRTRDPLPEGAAGRAG